MRSIQGGSVEGSAALTEDSDSSGSASDDDGDDGDDDDDDADGGAAARMPLAEQYSWQPPPAYALRLRLRCAAEAARGRATYLRTVRGWDAVADRRTGEAWWVRGATAEARWTAPPECGWPRLLRTSSLRGYLGLRGRWAVYDDGDGNLFYQDTRRLRDCRWEKPPDAAAVDESARTLNARCTRFAFGGTATEQAW
jgi:hypothetical protein